MPYYNGHRTPTGPEGRLRDSPTEGPSAAIGLAFCVDGRMQPRLMIPSTSPFEAGARLARLALEALMGKREAARQVGLASARIGVWNIACALDS